MIPSRRAVLGAVLSIPRESGDDPTGRYVLVNG